MRRGAEGGALATAVMTVYRLPVTRSLPPTAEFWATFVSGGDPADSPVAALVLHVVYGVAAGAIFAVVLRTLLDTDPDDRFAFHVSHLLYGITLGAWVGTRTRDRDRCGETD
jgi:predicted MFS family arabinose efflux permease